MQDVTKLATGSRFAILWSPSWKIRMMSRLSATILKFYFNRYIEILPPISILAIVTASAYSFCSNQTTNSHVMTL